MAKAKNTQDRKQIKGLLLYYYRALYSAYKLRMYHNNVNLFDFFLYFKFGLTLLCSTFLLTPIYLITKLPIKYIFYPIFVKYPIMFFLLNFIYLFNYIILFYLIYLFVKNKLASYKIIEKISQYEEVVIYDFFENKRYWFISATVFSILAVLFAMINVRLLSYFDLF